MITLSSRLLQPFKAGHFPLAVGDERAQLHEPALACGEPLQLSSGLRKFKIFRES
jgi:hypothetical protein